MSVKVIWSCPLGHTCEDVKDGAVHRCAWLVKLKGKDPQSEDKYNDWRCAIAWMPIVGTENSQTNRGQTQAIEKLHSTVAKTKPITIIKRELNGQNRNKLPNADSASRLIHEREDLS